LDVFSNEISQTLTVQSELTLRILVPSWPIATDLQHPGSNPVVHPGDWWL